WRNILVRLDSGGPAIFLIDSSRGGVRRTWLSRHHGRIRDLASLDKLARFRLTATERLRWVRWYLGEDDLAWRSLVRAVLRYAGVGLVAVTRHPTRLSDA